MAHSAEIGIGSRSRQGNRQKAKARHSLLLGLSAALERALAAEFEIKP